MTNVNDDLSVDDDGIPAEWAINYRGTRMSILAMTEVQAKDALRALLQDHRALVARHTQLLRRSSNDGWRANPDRAGGAFGADEYPVWR